MTASTASTPYAAEQPERAEIDALKGATVLEFGANWCGICKAAQSTIAKAFAGHGDVAHLKVEDGSGRPLGRSFGVKLWPTLIFLRDGREVDRVVRPENAAQIEAGLARLG